MKDIETRIYPPRFALDFLRFVAFVISKTCWFIRYQGRENIPPASFGSFLIAANHQTYIDPVWICLPMRRRIRYMAFDKAFEWRVVGPLIRSLGAFPVPMETKGAFRAMKEALRSLRNGGILTVFPEGAREFADGELLPFKLGAVRIALQAGVPILPVTVRGGNRIWPRKQRYPKLFRGVEIIYHPLFEVSLPEKDITDEDLERWTEKLREVIAADMKLQSD